MDKIGNEFIKKLLDKQNQILLVLLLLPEQARLENQVLALLLDAVDDFDEELAQSVDAEGDAG